MNVSTVEEAKPKVEIPEICPGDVVKVRAKVVEAGRRHSQLFQGTVIKVRRGGVAASFTVRHLSKGVGVEWTFLFNSPLIEKVEVVRHGKVRRAKLYYLRGLSGRLARIKEKREKPTES